MSTFDETKIRRDSDGKFGTKDGDRDDAGQLDDAFDDGLQPAVEAKCGECDGDIITDTEGITTHLDETGNEDWEANASHIPTAETQLDRDHDEIAGVLDEYERCGVLNKNPGDWGKGVVRLETEEVLLGRTPDGSRVTAHMAVRCKGTDDKNPIVTTDLKPASESYGASITFMVTEKGKRDFSSSGRFDDLQPEEQALVPEALRKVSDNHLNDLVAGTDKQMEQFREIQQRPDTNGGNVHNRAFAEIEPDRGYSFGSNWLYRPVKPEVFRDGLDAIAGLHRGKK